MTIAVDYDGTIIEDGAYPYSGKIKPYAALVLKWLKDQGHQLILWTCREEVALDRALELCSFYGIEFDAVNSIIHSFNSRKVVASVYIDDSAWPHITIDWKHIGRSFGMGEKDFDK